MSMVEQVVADLSHGGRWLRRHPRFAVLSTLIIAIGLGGSTAIFSVADAVVLRPLPYAEVDRLFVIQEHDQPRGAGGPASYPFAYPDGADAWLAMRAEEPLLSAAMADRLFEDIGAGVDWLTVIGRLRRDVSLDVARDGLTGMWRRMYRRSLCHADVRRRDSETGSAAVHRAAVCHVCTRGTDAGSTRFVCATRKCRGIAHA
jgi:hypothetical protein